ncbi:hypothetical protein C8024_15980 [Sphingopyxis sp. BSNA05]|nr:hypothetical protein [Sphingopyxis sp. BSNA05]
MRRIIRDAGAVIARAARQGIAFVYIAEGNVKARVRPVEEEIFVVNPDIRFGFFKLQIGIFDRSNLVFRKTSSGGSDLIACPQAACEILAAAMNIAKFRTE